MKTKRFSLITILAVIMLAFTTLFGISLKSDKASAAVEQTGYAKVMVSNGGTNMVNSAGAYQIDPFTADPATIEAVVSIFAKNNWNGTGNQGAIIGGRYVGNDYFNLEVYNDYNSLQRLAGLDISDYKGKNAIRYTYIVTNFPNETEEKEIRANVLTVNGRPIAGDIMTVSLDGFMYSLNYLKIGR